MSSNNSNLRKSPPPNTPNPPNDPRPPKAPAPPSRPMKFPYTFTAKLVQFPWAFYVKNNWVYRYYVIAIIVSMPIFYKLQVASYSPGNVAMWKEIRQKYYEDVEEH